MSGCVRLIAGGNIPRTIQDHTVHPFPFLPRDHSHAADSEGGTEGPRRPHPGQSPVCQPVGGGHLTEEGVGGDGRPERQLSAVVHRRPGN